MAETLLTLCDIVVRYGERTALRVPSLDILSGDVWAIIGPNGSGKSTLLRVMGSLQRPSAGRVLWRGTEARQGNSLSLRRRIATVFQEPLLLNASVYENAALGLKLRGLAEGEIETRLRPWLERLGIGHLAAQSARKLSGGEAQRTSLARALALEPELLLLDEPFAALDPASREELLRDFQPIVKEAKMTAVFVTHDREEAFAFADRVAVVKDGCLLQLGPSEEIFFRPNSPTVAEIVGITNRLAGTVEETGGEFTVVRVNRQFLRVAGEFDIGAKVLLCIRPETVTIQRCSCAAENLNQLRGRIIGISPGIARQRITVDCGAFSLTTLMDRMTFLEAAYNEDDEVVVLVSPTLVHVITELE